MGCQEDQQVRLAERLATRFEQLGLEHYFAIPGDYNLVLLDELLKHKKLKMINCCNELFIVAVYIKYPLINNGTLHNGNLLT